MAKAALILRVFGTTEVVPFQNKDSNRIFPHPVTGRGLSKIQPQSGPSAACEDVSIPNYDAS